ncbi:MAG TPA: protein translocase subunit SecF [Thermoanaerobaculia bacterium]|jgi:preprotein translocase subunit SecF
MELLRDTHIDFMKYRKFWIVVSLVLVMGGVYAIWNHARLMNLGIDFAGGTTVKLRFKQSSQVDELRRLLETQGLGAAEIQRYGADVDHEIIIKTRVIKGSEEGSRDRIVQALNHRYNQGQQGKVDLNAVGVETVTQFLLQADPDHVAAQGVDAATAHYSATANAILSARRKAAVFHAWDEVAKVPGVSPAVVQALQRGGTLGDYAIIGVETVGPQIGKELRAQGFWAVIFSLLGMLAYIWFRFELRFGIGAIMASLHDVLVTLGLFTLFRLEFNLTTIAAFLTLVGYSTNDTVVIFDRIRENMRKNRRKPLIEVMNESINQTLSRTIMTSGLTMLTVASLLFLGGDVLRGFAFVMTVGIVVGTYSSIYVASPFALLWEQLFGAEGRLSKKNDRLAAAAKPAPAAKAPSAKPAPSPAAKQATPPAAAPRPAAVGGEPGGGSRPRQRSKKKASGRR